MTRDRARNVVVFGASGAIAGAVAEEFVRAGDRLYLSSRQETPPAKWRGRVAEWARVDATDVDQVDAYYASLASKAVIPDVVFNGIGLRAAEGGFGTPSHSLHAAKFNQTLTSVVGAQFLTASRGAWAMAKAGRGVVILLTSSLAKVSIPNMAGITAASDAVEGLARVLQAEHVQSGVRVVCARVGGMPETRMIMETMAANATTAGVSVDEHAQHLPASRAGIAPLTLRAAAKAIALLASEDAAPLSFEPVNVGFA